MIMKNKFKMSLFGLLLLQLFSVPMHAGWFWHEPAPMVVVHRPVVVHRHVFVERPAPVVDGVAAGIFGVGLGIAAIAHHCSKKSKFREYVQTFRDMGYGLEQSRIYAQMAMNSPEGLHAVLRSIDQEKMVQAKAVVQQELMQQTHDQKQVELEKIHHQKMQEMSHEQKLNLLTYMVMFLTTIILIGVGFLLYKRK